MYVRPSSAQTTAALPGHAPPAAGLVLVPAEALAAVKGPPGVELALAAELENRGFHLLSHRSLCVLPDYTPAFRIFQQKSILADMI